jgi:cobalt/nickel transport protein
MNKKDILFGLFAALLLAILISPFASSFPDGLERVAEDKGFLEKGEIQPAMVSPVPDYAWPGIKNEKLATSAAGIMGTLIVFGAAYGFAALIKRKENA